MMREKTKATIFLSFLSPFIGEIITGSTPPLDFFDPLFFLVFWTLYGSGVLLVRELWIKWGQKYGSLLLLGLTFGIIKEGIAGKSFYIGEHIMLSSFWTYSSQVGLSVIWGVWLAIYHAVFSITIPILLIHLFYPKCNEGPFLSDRAFYVTTLLFLTALIYVFLFLNPTCPPLLPYLFTCFITLYLVKKARDGVTIGNNLLLLAFIKRPMLLGALFTFTLFFLFTLFSLLIWGAIFTCGIILFLLLQLYGGLTKFSKTQTFALILGLLLPLLLFLDILIGFSGSVGLSLIGIATFIVLMWKYQKIKTDTAQQANGQFPKKKDKC